MLMNALQPLFNFESYSPLVYEILTLPLLIYFGAASHFRDFLGLSVKTTTESIGHTRKCDKFNH